ncbi:MAG: hypothetical protein IPL79_15345 [Myxococcales bacterium]|nr:hypothetical protein [Myxococcales bacterium]
MTKLAQVATLIVLVTMMVAVGARDAEAACLGGVPDGMVAPSEDCDDDNAIAGDGCSPSCDLEAEFSCARAFSFDDLTIEDFPGGNAAWTLTPPATGVQTVNTNKPTIARFGDDGQRGTYLTEMNVQTTNDDDLMGFALGFNAGDSSNASADWIVIDWKQAAQSGQPAGLRVAHVRGAPNNGSSVSHDIQQRVQLNPTTYSRQLTTGRRFGTTGWADNTTYTARIEYRPGRLLLWIDDQLELDLEPTDFPGEFTGDVFPAGEAAFYLLSQDQVRYTNLAPYGPSSCNVTSLSNARSVVTIGTASVTTAIANSFSDVDDALNNISIAITSNPVGATASVVGGDIIVTPNNASIAGIYRVNYLACDDNPVIPDCDDAVLTVVYAPDSDGDGTPNPSDLDDDNDGIVDTAENLLGLDPDGDNDGDDVANFLDRDDRGDGAAQICVDVNVDDICDAPGLDFNRDGEGSPNHIDLDSDNDLLFDTWEGNGGIVDVGPADGIIDCAGNFGANGLCNANETSADSGVVDYDGNGSGPDATRATDDDALPDFLDRDADGDGLRDAQEGDVDTNGNSVPDVRELDSDGDGLTDLLEGDAGCADVAVPLGRCDGADADGDGLADDAAATLPDTDGDGLLDYQDLDADGDGLADATEGTFDTDGDGLADFRDLDSDNDGIPDVIEGASGCADASPLDAMCDGPDANSDGLADAATNQTPPDTDGDTHLDYRDLDSDNDGGSDRLEGGSACVDTAPADELCDGPDANDDGLADDATLGAPTNSDGDAVPDYRDLDSDQDGLLDIVELASGCTDAGENGVCDGPDTDGDGLVDSLDGDPAFGDPTPTVPPNADGTGLPDFRDPDSDDDGNPDTDISGCVDTTPADDQCDGGDVDNDGVVDPIDGFDGHGIAVPEAGDNDGDGIPDDIDLDDDNDGIPDADEGDGDVDTDADGTPDSLDPDSDNDGLTDADEAGHGQPDGNGDGVIDCPSGVGDNGLCDDVETAPDSGTPGFTPTDTDDDGTPDFQDVDSDNDGVADGTDICRFDADADQRDLDGDGFGDACDEDDDNDGFRDNAFVRGGGCQAGPGGGAGATLPALLVVGIGLAARRRRVRSLSL